MPTGPITDQIERSSVAYQRGVADERERCAKIAESWSLEAAAAIREHEDFELMREG
jgi:hypothetical protein